MYQEAGKRIAKAEENSVNRNRLRNDRDDGTSGQE